MDCTLRKAFLNLRLRAELLLFLSFGMGGMLYTKSVDIHSQAGAASRQHVRQQH